MQCESVILDGFLKAPFYFIAKASTIADQLMQNPEMLSAIQTKLAGMVDSRALMRRFVTTLV